MPQNLVATVTLTIAAPQARVWEALTEPDLIAQYLFGTQVTTDWKVGSPITYRGVWEGKPYEDKGIIQKIEPGRLLVSTYWSPLSGVPDKPEFYKTVTYELAPDGAGTRLTLSQDNNAGEDERSHSESNWTMVMQGLKKLVEG